MEDQIKQLQADIKELHKLVTDLRIQVATKSGAHIATAWWAAGVAALIAAWLGVTTIWHIPALVRATGAGQAQQAAELASKQAQADASTIAEIKKTLPNAVSYDDPIKLVNKRDLNSPYALEAKGPGAVDNTPVENDPKKGIWQQWLIRK